MKERISNRQRIMLQELRKNKEMFVAELKNHPELKGEKVRLLRSSMYLLFKRKLVKRTISYNTKSRPNCHNQYKYMLTAKGEDILSKTKKKSEIRT